MPIASPFPSWQSLKTEVDWRNCREEYPRRLLERRSSIRMHIPWQLLVLFVTGLAAGFVDSIAGGGGLITLPVLLSLGIRPQQAIATNKLQATFGSGSAAWHYAGAKTVPLNDCARGFACS